MYTIYMSGPRGVKRYGQYASLKDAYFWLEVMRSKEICIQRYGGFPGFTYSIA